MYKKGDKVIILDYNGKPLIPKVVAEIEEYACIYQIMHAVSNLLIILRRSMIRLITKS